MFNSYCWLFRSAICRSTSSLAASFSVWSRSRLKCSQLGTRSRQVRCIRRSQQKRCLRLPCLRSLWPRSLGLGSCFRSRSWGQKTCLMSGYRAGNLNRDKQCSKVSSGSNIISKVPSPIPNQRQRYIRKITIWKLSYS